MNRTEKIIDSDISNLMILIKDHLFISLDSVMTGLSDDLRSEMRTYYIDLEKKAIQQWNLFIGNKIAELKNTNKVLEREIDVIKNDSIYKKAVDYYAQNSVYLEREKSLNEQKSKLDEIDRLESEVQKLNTACCETQKKIISAHIQYFSKLNDILAPLTTSRDEIEITASSQFNNKRLEEILEICFNKKSGKGNEYLKYEYKDIDSYNDYCLKLFEDIKNEKILLRSGSDKQKCLIDIFSENFFSSTYMISYDGDNLDSMSEGKKAFVILRLLLDFTEEKCPILIDQPEDDLDNRAIYEQLVQYLRNKKKNRQIIVVTHNPNVVVGADAELVIVANQNGVKNKNQDNVQFEYYAGSLENSFLDSEEPTVLLSKGIREHVCEILEGGDEAFKKRERKYGYID